MSHVREGDLHAYLDGALEEYPVHEAERIRSHLEECGECMARLEEERAERREPAVEGEVQAGLLEEERASPRVPPGGSRSPPGKRRL